MEQVRLRKHVPLKNDLHKMLKQRALDRDSTIIVEADVILRNVLEGE